MPSVKKNRRERWARLEFPATATVLSPALVRREDKAPPVTESSPGRAPGAKPRRTHTWTCPVAGEKSESKGTPLNPLSRWTVRRSDTGITCLMTGQDSGVKDVES